MMLHEILSRWVAAWFGIVYMFANHFGWTPETRELGNDLLRFLNGEHGAPSSTAR